MTASRIALLGACALAAVLVVVCLTDDSVVRLSTTEWTPTGQGDVHTTIAAGHDFDILAETQASNMDSFLTPTEVRLRDNSEGRDFELEASSFGDVDLDLGATEEEVLLQKPDAVKTEFVKAFTAIKPGATHHSTRNAGVGATIDFGDDLATHQTDFPKELMVPAGLEKNCVTLRAYAVAIADNFNDDAENGAKLSTYATGVADGGINVLRDVLEGMAKAPKKDETCSSQFKGVMMPLRSNQAWNVKNGIAHDMLKTVWKEMNSKRGILVFKSGQDMGESGCLDDGTSMTRAEECKKIALSRASGQFVLIDANRVGWSGNPAVFTDLAVRVTTYLRALHATGANEEHIVQNRARDLLHKHIVIPKAQSVALFEGMCIPRKGATAANAAACTNVAKGLCKGKASCVWRPAWQGQMVAEEEFLEVAEEPAYEPYEEDAYGAP